LLAVADWTIRDGERWVIEGPSGTGKTTLLRAIAGLWPDGAGQVAMTKRGSVMLVPQRLYLPLGTLKSAICFPDRAEDHDDAVIAALLERVRLDAHVGAMHELRMWQDELSPASSSGWRWPASCSSGPACWCWTRRRARSMPTMPPISISPCWTRCPVRPL
jgi:ABC-type uncharacterized transport system fused permease/ATPase subunit